MAAVAYVASTNELLLSGVTDSATGAPVNNANVTVTVKDSAGQPVAGFESP